MAQWFSRYIHTYTAVDIKPKSHWGKDLEPLSVPRNRWRLPLLLVFSLLLIHCRSYVFSLLLRSLPSEYISLSLCTPTCTSSDDPFFDFGFSLFYCDEDSTNLGEKKFWKKRVLRKKVSLFIICFCVCCILRLRFFSFSLARFLCCHCCHKVYIGKKRIQSTLVDLSDPRENIHEY